MEPQRIIQPDGTPDMPSAQEGGGALETHSVSLQWLTPRGYGGMYSFSLKHQDKTQNVHSPQSSTTGAAQVTHRGQPGTRCYSR